MNTINETYINALLADAAYVNLHEDPGNNSDPLKTGSRLTDAMSARLTQPQADFITSNFEVLNQELSPTGGFDAVVWRGKAGTEYAGKTYVSMRGTQGLQDISDDVTLAARGIPHQQIADMVNWWLKSTASTSNEQVAQIKVVTDMRDGLPFYSFALAGPTTGSGVLASVTNITAVNGHSLGGYLATAFTRLFGANVQSVNTYNSAGFSNVAATNTQSSFDQIAQLIGANLGLGSLDAVAALQTNYYADNGWSVTTNTWGEIGFLVPGFNQYGNRVALFQEDLLNGNPIANHSVYKQTDLLALGAALEKLDPTFTIDKLNTLLKAGSNDMAGSYEGVLDALLKALEAPNMDPIPVGDVGDSAASRVRYHEALAALMKKPAFTSLEGKLIIKASNATDLVAAARYNFGALVALQDLSPLVISAINPTANDVLNFFFQQSRAADYTAWQADKSATTPSNFTDPWMADRAAMLEHVIQRNTSDIGGILSGSTNLRYFDAGSNTEILVGAGASNDQRVQYLFGGDVADLLEGKGFADHLYGGTGNDTLNGKAGDDYLEGGIGTDKYQFSDTYGRDTILDADGLGAIQIGSDTLNGGKKVGDNMWISSDSKYLYTLDGTTLSINQRDNASAGSITVKNYTAGQLGLSLEGAKVPTVTSNILNGDFGKLELNGVFSRDGINYASDGNSAPGAADLITGSAAAETINGLGGNDALNGLAGDDVINGGDGVDIIYGPVTTALSYPSTYTAIDAFASQYAIVGGWSGINWTAGPSGDDSFWGDGRYAARRKSTSLTGWGVNTETSDAGNTIDGGAGNDDIYAGTGNDLVHGGADDDYIYGMGGSDVLMGDASTGRRIKALHADVAIKAGGYDCYRWNRQETPKTIAARACCIRARGQFDSRKHIKNVTNPVIAA